MDVLVSWEILRHQNYREPVQQQLPGSSTPDDTSPKNDNGPLGKRKGRSMLKMRLAHDALSLIWSEILEAGEN